MPANQFFTDWVTGDLITATKLNQMKNDVQPYLGYVPVNKAGDTMTGVLTIASSSDGILNLQQLGIAGTAGVKDPGWNYIQFIDSEGDRQGYFGIDSGGNFRFTPEIPGARVTVAGNTVWHAGNDGAGSGLSADDVDGYHVSALALAPDKGMINQANININANSTYTVSIPISANRRRAWIFIKATGTASPFCWIMCTTTQTEAVGFAHGLESAVGTWIGQHRSAGSPLIGAQTAGSGTSIWQVSVSPYSIQLDDVWIDSAVNAIKLIFNNTGTVTNTLGQFYATWEAI